MMDIVNKIMYLALIFVVGVAAVFVIHYVQQLINKAKQQTDNEQTKDLLDAISNIVINCVLATNQTYVDSLKDKNLFDEAAHKEAFNKTYTAATAILTDEMKELLDKYYGGMEQYLTTLIESQINQLKK